MPRARLLERSLTVLILLLAALPSPSSAAEGSGLAERAAALDQHLDRLERLVSSHATSADSEPDSEPTEVGSRPRGEDTTRRLQEHLRGLETQALSWGAEGADVLERLSALRATLEPRRAPAPREPAARSPQSPLAASAARAPRAKTFLATNDRCESAIPIGNGTFVAELGEASQDGTASCGFAPSTRDVWFRYAPTSDGFVAAGLAAPNDDLTLSVHSGCPGTELNQLSCTHRDPLIFTTEAGREVWIRVAVHSESSVDTAAFEVGTASVVTGRVVDEVTGQPIAGATVHLYGDSEFPVSQGETDADGRFRAPVPTPGTYIATAGAEGYLPQAFDGIPCPGDPTLPCFPPIDATPFSVPPASEVGDIDFALSRLGRISGQVRDAADGSPLAFVEVRLAGPQETLEVRTDEQGNYLAEGLEPGIWKVSAASFFYQDELWDDIPCQPFCNPANGTPISIQLNTHAQGIDFDLQPQGRISGRVTSAATGEPIRFVSIEIYDSDGQIVGGSQTDTEGRYVAGGLPAGTYRAKTFALFIGFVDELYEEIQCLDCDLDLGTPIQVSEGQEVSNIDFTLDAGGQISGRITNAITGEGIESRILLYDGEGIPLDIFFTDPEGFTISGLRPGAYFLEASATGFVSELYDNIPCTSESPCDPLSGSSVVVAIATETSGIDFALEPFGTISGTVLDADSGEPIANATLYVAEEGDSLLSAARTDENGRYRITAGSATYRVAAGHPSYRAEAFEEQACSSGNVHACDLSAATPIVVEVRSNTTGIDFTLDRLSSIRGTVRDRRGRPVSGISIRAEQGDERWFAVSADDGSYVLDGLETGGYLVTTRATFDGYLATIIGGGSCEETLCDPSDGTPVQVVLGSDTEQDLVLDRRGIVTGRVTDGFWGEGVDADVALWDATGRFQGSFSADPEGFYEVVAPEDDTFFLTASGSRLLAELFPELLCVGLGCDKSAGTPFVLELNTEIPDIDFELGLQQGIVGTVTDESTGLPLADVQVEVWDDFGPQAGTVTGPSGRFFFALPIDTYYLQAQPFGSGTFEAQVYENLSCPRPSACIPRDGTPVEVGGDQIVEGIDFRLNRRECAPDASTLCLNEARFRVRASFSDFAGEGGAAEGQVLTADSGTFTFFDPDNVELVVKVLDACGSEFDSYWVFAAGLTNLEVDLEVTDTAARQTRLYTNRLGDAFELVRDTGAFETCSFGVQSDTNTLTADDAPTIATIASDLQTELERLVARNARAETGTEAPNKNAATGSETCTPSDTALCLQQGRYRVEATWTDADGATDSARVVQLTPDTGYFWFFDPDNVEVITKVLDACGSEFDSFWVFAAGLTDVGVVLRVTDTVSGQVEEYENPLGTGFVPIQDTGTFQTCM